jgi:integrase/recombinase XerD
MSVYKRGAIWWYKFQHKGTRYQESSGSTLRAVAVKAEAKRREQIEKLASGADILFEDLMVRFAEEHWPTIKPGSVTRYRVSGKALIPHFHGKMLSEVNKATIQDFIRKRRAAGVTDSTIRKDIACLSSALTCAVEWDLTEHNIVKSLPRKSLAKTNDRVRWLRTKERAALIAVCDERMRQIIETLIGTGMRLGELCTLEYRNVDGKRMEIYLEKTKTDAPRTIPITAHVWLQIRLQPRSLLHEYVFSDENGKPWSVTRLSKRIAYRIAAAKIDDFRPHDLRHTFASDYMQNGGKIERLQLILGHSRIGQTSKYSHLSTEDLHEDMERVATKKATAVTD